MTDFGPEDERLEGIYERMEELDPAKFEVDAAKLLHGLGFDKAMMAKGTKDMSGESCCSCCSTIRCVSCSHTVQIVLSERQPCGLSSTRKLC